MKLVGDYFRMRAEKYEVLGTLPQSQRTFVMSGYVAAKAVPAIEKAIGERYDCVLDVEDLKEDEEPPIILKNNAFSSSVEASWNLTDCPIRVNSTQRRSCHFSMYFSLE